MKRIYACFAIVAALLATAFYSSFQVQRFADDISTGPAGTGSRGRPV